DAPFPAQIEDCKAAIRWLRAHAEEYGLDAKAFGVGGSSAGGHLVALVGTSGGVREFDVGQHLDMSSAVQAVYDLYGPTDLIRFGQTPGYESHATAESPEGKLLGGAPAQMKEAAAKANPITHIDANDPPFLIVHGDADPTVPINQSESLYAALVEAGIPTRFITIQGGGHGRGFPSEPLVEIANVFFDKNLRGNAEAADWPKAMTSELKAAAANLQRPDNARPRIPFAILQRREDTNGDGQITRDEFKGPPAIFDHLDKNGDQVLTKSDWE
ncbi:MAG: prolyl oligopeptidase family serine peptidase, partial [Verrucomicrobiales bacterium]|nr:prolyl oligopeptidase family serine peptidase [Verrucomicrobiales bacterium]